MFSFTAASCIFMYFVRKQSSSSIIFIVSIVFFQVSHATTQDQEVPTTYEGAQVWRTKLRNDQEINAIKKLVEIQAISIWKLEQDHADYLIKADNKLKVNRVLNALSLNHSVLIMDVQRKVDALRVEPALWNENSLRIGHRLNWKEYPTMTIIDEYYVYLTQNFPSICNVTTIGHTSENRAIKMIKISNGNPDNQALLITSGVHAREWITITSALYVLDKIVTKFDQLPSYMRTIEWIFVPVVNPDGYEYSHTHDRLWRKNRRKLKTCTGVDINRNYDTDWDIIGITNKYECSGSYAGPHAFSEAESISLRNMIESSKKKPRAMLDLHSYGQLILYPWSAKAKPTPDRRLLWLSAKGMSEAIYNTTGSNYTFGATYHMIHPATGVAIDWMYSSGVLMPFGVELRDKATHGFLMPAENIEPTGAELLVAVRELVREFDPEQVQRRGVYDSWF